MDDMVEDTNEEHNKSNNSQNQAGTNRWDTSTMGGVHSIGSDLTRTKGKSDMQQNGSNNGEPTMSKLRENGHNTPTSKTRPIASIESYATRVEKGRNGNANLDDQMNIVVCSGRSSVDKRSRKASTLI